MTYRLGAPDAPQRFGTLERATAVALDWARQHPGFEIDVYADYERALTLIAYTPGEQYYVHWDAPAPLTGDPDSKPTHATQHHYQGAATLAEARELAIRMQLAHPTRAVTIYYGTEPHTVLYPGGTTDTTRIQSGQIEA